MPVESIITGIAAEIVLASSRECPADRALRERLRAERGLSAEKKRVISRAVFAYFRWFGWLNPEHPLPAQIEHALKLADDFAERPRTFSDEKLVACVAPGWVNGLMRITPGWARAIQAEPKLWLRAKKGQGRALAKELGNCLIPPEPMFADALEYRGNEDLFRAPEFHAGEFEVQDISSQMVGLLCDPQPGETWWDACAGEGGKTLHLSDLMANRGLIWASDRASWRLQLLKRRAGRAKVFNYRAANWAGGPKLPTRTKFDGVLVDAPCSGVGTWQRNPHARWTISPEDVKELADIQKRLLANVASAVKPGGRLIYAVCTLTRAETLEVGRAFQNSQAEFEPIPLKCPFGEKSGDLPASAASMTLWPQDCGGNGMFMAAWRRRA